MKRRKFIKQTSASLALASVGSLTLKSCETKTKHITILHTNDTHSQIEPFDNTLVVVELNYDKIKALFNYFVAKKRAHPLSKNIQLTIENDSYNVLINGKPIKKDRTYFVATSNYLQKGGDGMIFFSEPESLFDSNFLIRDAIVDYFESKDTLRATLDERVIIN